MFDAEGPGAIVRFWLTTAEKPGKMRFYFDNESSASVEIPAFDLMKAGFNLGPVCCSLTQVMIRLIKAATLYIFLFLIKAL